MSEKIFSDRHIGPNSDEVTKMLSEIGENDLTQFINKVEIGRAHV